MGRENLKYLITSFAPKGDFLAILCATGTVKIFDDVADEMSMIKPIMYEDKDESDEKEPEDAVETDEDNEEVMEAINGFNDFEGSGGMTD